MYVIKCELIISPRSILKLWDTKLNAYKEPSHVS